MKTKKPAKKLTISYYVEPENIKFYTVKLSSFYTFTGLFILSIIGSFYYSNALNNKDFAAIKSDHSFNQKVFLNKTINDQMSINTKKATQVKNESLIKIEEGNLSKQLEKYKKKEVNIAKNNFQKIIEKPKVIKIEPPKIVKRIAKPSNKFAAPAESAAKSFNINIQKMILSDKQNQVKLKLGVNNIGSTTARGKVWGIATFIDKNNRKILIGNNKKINVNNPEDANNIANGIKFKATKVSYKNFDFKKPIGSKLEKISVYVYDKPEKQTGTFTFSD